MRSKKTLSETVDYDADPDVSLWKAVGDELIYSAEVRDELDVCLVVDAWQRAMEDAQVSVPTKEVMPLKGGAWIATFPLPDRAIAVPAAVKHLGLDIFDPDKEPEVNNRSLFAAAAEGHDNDIRVDYLGPSMDIGFRVLTRSTVRKFVVSMEVAWLYAIGCGRTAAESRLYFDGEVEFKGVWGGRGYPLFWLDTGNHHNGQTTIDRLGNVSAVDLRLVRELGQSLAAEDHWPTKLYMPDSSAVEVKVHHALVERELDSLNEIQDTSGEMPAVPE